MSLRAQRGNLVAIQADLHSNEIASYLAMTYWTISFHQCKSHHFIPTPKIFSKKIAQSINCIYICNQSVANYMRRDIYQAIADPTRRAILTLLVTGAMTPNAIAEHFDSSRQAVSKHIQILTE